MLFNELVKRLILVHPLLWICFLLCLVRRHCCGILHCRPKRGSFSGDPWEEPEGGKASNSINDHVLQSLSNSHNF